MILKRVGPLSIAKVLGLLYAVLGLVFGAFLALFGSLGAMAGEERMSGIYGLFFGVGALFFMPVLYGGMGFVFGLVGAALYNLTAGMVGGIEVELEPSRPPAAE